MGDRPDITIPEEAINATARRWQVWPEVWQGESVWPAKIRALLEAAAPLIVAAALSELADQIDVRGVDDASAHLRARAAELRGGEPQP